MELILFTTTFPFGSGEQFLEGEIQYLAKSFSRITIIPLTNNGSKQSRSIPENVTCMPAMLTVTLFDKMKLLLLAVFNRQPIALFLAEFFRQKVFLKGSWMMNWLSFSSIARAAMQSHSYREIRHIITPATVVYFYWGDKSATFCPFLKKEFPGNKVIARFHGSDLYEIRTPGYMPFRETLLKHLDLAVFISSHGKDFLVNRFPSLPFKTWVSRLGVTAQGDGIPSVDGILRIITCSNVVKIKQLHLMVEALHLVDFKVEWTHIGEGILLEGLRDLTFGLPENIVARFLGALSNPEVIQYYRVHPVDLFANVSANEGLPVSIMEAISFGIPVIAPAVGGIPEIVNQELGVLMSPKLQQEEIAEAITFFYKLPENEKGKRRLAAKQQWKNHFNAGINYPAFCEKIKLFCSDGTP